MNWRRAEYLVALVATLVVAAMLWQDAPQAVDQRHAGEETIMHDEDKAGRSDSGPRAPAALGRGPWIDAGAKSDLAPSISRAAFLKGGAALVACNALATYPSAAEKEEARMLTRPIPSSGEALPVIGLGTWQVFDVGADKAERAQRGDVLKELVAAGGSVVDSSPMYGRAEGVAGDLIESLGIRDKTFIATKVWTSGKADGIAQMDRSFKLFKTDKIDLMQVHNLLDYKTHLDTLRGWQKDGRVRYLGVTHYTASAFAQLEAVLRAEKPDFVQMNYAVDDRAAEKTLLPLCQEMGIAVLVNRPFGGGGLMRRLKGKPLPDFASEIGATSWAQLLLKFIIAHPAITCAIPGTAKPAHMKDNAQAGIGALPDTKLRELIAVAAEA